MPSKLRKAIAAVKDSTRIGLAKVSSPTDKSNLQVAILKATTHEDAPLEDRYINEILHLTSSSRAHASTCARALSKRLGRTRNWIVALKALVVSLHLFRDGDPHFPKEVLVIMKRGGKFLNLNNFRDDCSSCPWDYTAFVRTIAGYLKERLECFITGRLLRRSGKGEKENVQLKYLSRKHRYSNEHVCEMKPAVLLDRITHWQRLLDKAMSARPTGPAKNNRLVQMSMYGMIRETFDLYRDISDGLALLLDSFFHLPHQICSAAYQACIRSSEQFKELDNFYAFCKGIDVGRPSEYPTVQMISEELMETLQEFLKDLSSFPSDLPYDSQTSLKERRPDSVPEPLEKTSTVGEGSKKNGQQMSLEELLSVTEPGASSPLEDFQSVKTGGTSPALSVDQDRNNDMQSLHTAGTSPAMSINQRTSSVIDLSLFEDAIQVHTAGTSPAMSINQRTSSVIDSSLFQDALQTQVIVHTAGTSPAMSINQRTSSVFDLSLFEDAVQTHVLVHTAGISPAMSINQRTSSVIDLSLFEDAVQVHTAGTSPPMYINQRTSPVIDYSLFEDAVQTQIQEETNQPSVSGQEGESHDDWEIMLAETANKISSAQILTGYGSSGFPDNLDSQPSTSYDQSNRHNPFLTLEDELSIIPFPAADPLFSLPTFQATPTFSAQNPDETSANDLFDLPMSTVQTSQLIHEQQLWLQTQQKIIAKHLS